jgi:LysM domain
MTFDELWAVIDAVFGPQAELQVQTSLALFRAQLNQQTPGQTTVVRMYVAGSPGFGHQSSTVNIMRQLAAPVGEPKQGFGFAGRIDMYYEPSTADDPVDAEEKLQQLIPELLDGDHCVIGGAAVSIIALGPDVWPDAMAEFGFTGGVDEGQDGLPNLANRLNTRRFLAVQPFRWEAADELQALNIDPFTGNRTRIELRAQPVLGTTSFLQRGYFMPDPDVPAWADWTEIGYGDDADIVRYLTDPLIGIDLAPVYGIRSGKSMQLQRPAEERMFQVLAAALATQRLANNTIDPAAAPIVVLSCDAFGTDKEQAQLAALVAGGMTAWEQNRKRLLDRENEKSDDDEGVTPPWFLVAEAVVRGAGVRKRWLKAIQANANVRLLWDPDTVDAVQEGVVWAGAAPGRVLFVQLGRVPPPLFVWCMECAGWPAVFEGQNSANDALNIAKPYLHVARADNQGIQYPTDIVGYGAPPTTGWYQVSTGFDSPVPRQFQDAANQIGDSPGGWTVAPFPPQLAARLVRGYRAEPATGPMHRYLRRVESFYAIPANDKLRLAAAYSQYILAGGLVHGAAASAATSSVLDPVYASLQNNLSAQGVLRIAPGAFDAGGVYDFYTALLGDTGLVLAGAELIAHYDDAKVLVEIEAKGRTEFLGVPLAAQVRFTAPDGVVTTAGRYSPGSRWVIDQIPWIALEEPFISFDIADSGAPLAGAVGGALSGTGAELAFRLPAAAGTWQLVGAFAGPSYPSIASFYQLAGGVDLVRALPEPFAALAGFGLEDVELAYDQEEGQVSYIGFRMKTAAPVPLLGSLTMRDVTATVTVLTPGDTAARTTDWTVRGIFTMGKEGPEQATVQISATGPDTVLTGALVQGVLSIGEIVALFAPGVDLGIPDDLVVTEFQSTFAMATGEYQVTCALNIGWPVDVGKTTVFTIESLAFTAAGLDDWSNGQLSGYVTIDPDGAAFPLSLYGTYDDDDWTFGVAQAPDTKFAINTLFHQFLPHGWATSAENYEIADLQLTVAYTEGSWDFGGRTADYWTVPFIDGLKASAELALGYQAPGTDKPFGYTVRLSAEIVWHNIDITVHGVYEPEALEYGVTWGALEGKVVQKTVDGVPGPYTATLKFAEDTTIGSMIETMVSWATGSRFALESPWSVLNSIPVGGLALEYVFDQKSAKNNSVSFRIDIGPLDLGFARIDSVAVVYNDLAEHKVAITLRGSFPWNVGDGAVGDAAGLGPWDASAPGAAPAPPGAGNEYLDLRLLALGQHVSDPDLAAAQSVQQAIEIMGQLPDTDPGQLPAVGFSAASSWIIGADLGVLRFDEGGESGYLLTVQTVFNDPVLYALRLALAGPAAKVFAGLDFQIMYRQVSDTVGVYQAELVLPDAMRRLSIGAYTLTLPTTAVAVYTNGDFQVDVGFPWNGDFTRSFTIEGVIVPGIPVVGSAGFYFGRLSSSTTDRVPQALNGTFSPVIVFGLGLTFGFGKSVQSGPLKAGFSATVGGIVEGVLATFNPYLPATTGTGDPAQVQDGYYFWLRGAVAISGRLYGSVDFSVVKAEVDVSFSIMLQLTYESYVSMSVTVIVSVDVSASISIDLGLFSIKLSFSFSMRIQETFTLENGGTAPWITAGPDPAAHSLAGPADRRHRYRRALSPGAAQAAADEDRWTRLTESTGGVKTLKAWLAPGLTVAHNENDPAGSGRQEACYVLLPLIETVPADEGALDEVLARNAAATVDTSFELLAKMVLRWAISAVQPGQVTPEALDRRVVTEADLAHLRDTVLVSREGEQLPIGPGDVETFMGRQFRFELRQPTGTAVSSATAFPMPPAIRVSSKGYGAAYPAYDYTFAGYNALDDAAVQGFREYFDQLAVQVSEQPDALAAAAQAGTLSMAEWVQSDYFLLLARQMTQSALDALRDFKYEITPQTTPGDIVRDVNTTGQLTGGDQLSVTGLFTANGGRALTGGVVLTIAAGAVLSTDESFDALADRLGPEITATALALANAGDAALLRDDAVIAYQGSAPYHVQSGDTLISIAKHFKARFADFLSGSPGLLGDPRLLRAGRTVLVPSITCRARTESTFNTLAEDPAYASGLIPGMTGVQLAERNAARPVLRSGHTISYGSKDPYTVQPNDCLADVALALDVDLAILLDKGPITAQPGLLADAAVLILPPVQLKLANDQTLDSVAAQTAATAGTLGTWPANADVAGLFSAGTPGTAAAWVDIPHLVQYQVGAVIEEIQRTLGIRQLSRMAGRYSLHGTRLPTTGITPKTRGIWVTGEPGALKLPPKAGLFALTGQQIPVPDLSGQSGAAYAIVIDPPATPSWAVFPGGQMAIVLDPGSVDTARINSARGSVKDPFAMPLTSLGAGATTTSAPTSYPLTAATPWHSPESVTLPYGLAPKPAQVQDLQIRALPEALAALPDPRTPGKSAPRFAVRIAAYDESTGATSTTDVPSHGWATVAAFTVRRVPQVAGSPATADTYEILGAGGSDVVLLERIVDQIGAADGAFDQVVLAYAADTAAAGGAAGLQSDPQPRVTFGISQVNLSTETRPPSPALAAEDAAGDSASSSATMLNKPSAFIRLLWEASITRSGGFFLYYYDGSNARGLPERLFDDRGEAQVSLIVLYKAGGTTQESDRVHDYMTAVVTGTSIDTGQAVVFAEADPLEPAVDSGLGLSLAQLAERTYSDVGDLAAANAQLKLSSMGILIADGVYQAPPEGKSLQQIATDYGTDISALNTANPQYGGALPNPLPGLTAIFLPRMTVPGNGAHTSSLAQAAGYYGVNLTALAHDNAATTGLFQAGQSVQIPGGPMVRTATAAPGAVAVAASRPKPTPVPLDPRTQSDYGITLMQNNFSMLEYQVADNAFYSPSYTGLPAGPAPDAPNPSPDKVRVAPETSVWDYRQAIPASRFTKQAAAPAAAGLPDPQDSPYRGMGSIFQVQYSWLDYYGNTLITALDQQSAGSAKPWNKPPQLTGYTDALIGLGSWPSVAASWRVAGASGSARLELSLGFDPTPYQGLYRTDADASGGAVTALFTNPLEHDSAATIANYRIVRVDETGSGETVPVTAAAPSGDGLSVVLTLGQALTAGREYLLTITDLPGRAAEGQTQPTYSGSAGFPSAGSTAAHSSSTIERAGHDLGVYGSLYYQLTDPAGVWATLTTTLLTGPVPLDGTIWQGVLGWLFTAAGSVYAFLADRAAGGTGVQPPAAPHTITAPLDGAALSAEQIFRLTLTLTLERTSRAVLGDLRSTPAIRRSSTLITPATHPVDGQESLGLNAFARAFETALSVPGEHQLKVAGGVDRAAAGAAHDGCTLWAVRLGTKAGQPISYHVANAGDPELYAPRPVSNTLISRQAVPIYDYSPVSGIPTAGPTRKLDFADVDVDVWLRTLLGAVDGTLSPAFVAALQIVTGKVAGTNNDYLARILRAKKTLADWISSLMIPLYAGGTLTPETGEAVREAYRQQLLDRLSNAYSVRAGLQFRADVAADVHDPAATVDPRLFGGVLDKAAAGEARSEISLSSPKLPLRSGPGAALPILLSAPDALSRDGAVVGAVDLALAWAPTSIEHQIAEPAGIDGYLASSWLSFVLPDEPAGLLAADLGAFPVPLILRTFPAGPAMTGQTAAAASPGAADLAGLTKWTYSFTWSLPFHYEQDRVHGRVEFNLSANPAAAAPPDLFAQLAEFVTVYPQVRVDMDAVLASVDATTTNQDTLKNADIAARAFVDLLERITLSTAGAQTALAFSRPVPALVGTDELAYAFDVSEGFTDLPGPDGPTGTVRALLVTLHGRVPAGIDAPSILIEPGRYEVRPHPVDLPDAYGCCYFDTETGTYLTEADGQKIPARTMVLPGLDVFQRQDAWAGAKISRNEELVPGRRTAEAFVYTTPESRFADPQLPILDSDVPVDLGKLGGATAARTLDQQFITLFDELFADLPVPGGPLTIQAELHYGYRIAPDLAPVTLPIFFQPPKPVPLDTRGAGSPIEAMARAWAEAIRSWFTAAPPSGVDGTVYCDLAILSNLTAIPMPLFRLRGAYLRLVDVEPKLPTLAVGGI